MVRRCDVELFVYHCYSGLVVETPSNCGRSNNRFWVIAPVDLSLHSDLCVLAIPHISDNMLESMLSGVFGPTMQIGASLFLHDCRIGYPVVLGSYTNEAYGNFVFNGSKCAMTRQNFRHTSVKIFFDSNLQ